MHFSVTIPTPSYFCNWISPSVFSLLLYVQDSTCAKQAFKTKSDHHRIAAYNAIMTRLAARGLSVDLQILDNKASVAYKEAITFKWNATFQLVPPDMHRRNRAERAIRDLLLPQA